MNAWSNFKMSLRLLLRQWKSGQLWLLSLSIIVAVASATCIALISERLDSAILDRSAETLGGQLRLKSSTPIEDHWQKQADALGLNSAITLQFPTVVIAGEEMSLSALKAVGDHYPLAAKLEVAESADTSVGQIKNSGPQPGEVWLERRLFNLLNIKLDDPIELGESAFTVSGILLQESDRGGNFYTLSPRVMVNLSDIQSTGLIQPGSRVSWRLLLQGNAQSVAQFSDYAESQLADNQQLENLQDGNRGLARSLNRARSFLSLSALLALLLAGVATGMAARDFALKHYDTSALLRTMGLSRKQINQLFISQLFVLGAIASGIALIIGWSAHWLLVQLLVDVLPTKLPPAGIAPLVTGFVSGIAILLGFASPHFFRLGAVPPLRVLRRQLAPMPASSWLTYLSALLVLGGLFWWYSGDLTLTLIICGGGLISIWLLMQLFSWLIGVLAASSLLKNRGLNWRLASQQLARNKQQTAAQVLSFSLPMMIMLVVLQVRSGLLQDWQQSLPVDAPNQFALNIQRWQADDFAAAIAERNYQATPLYPMIPGRIIEVNSTPISEFSREGEQSKTYRDLMFGASELLPDGNEIVAGAWPPKDILQQLETSKSGSKDNTQTVESPLYQHQVSVAEGYADWLGLSIGDQLTLRASGIEFNATVSSLRKIDWGRMKPNFFLLFSPKLIEQLPVNMMTSFNVPEVTNATERAASEKAYSSLVRQFPTVTLLDISRILAQVTSMLQQVTLAVELLMVFVLLAALMVLLTALQSSRSDRARLGALLKTFGAPLSKVGQIFRTELVLLGLISGVLALLASQAVLWMLYQRIFEIEFQPQFIWWVISPIASVLLILISGQLVTRKALQTPPVNVLRQLG
ncbi:ABC transporter permease [Pelagibaculum spongiae]|uniref:ABC transporter permease n=1 Tax=Pelagibaculum spongiae TaxID=2080658 RepID=A0A2V1H4G3_9GAMM|nr:FtsX-like permease family protein [Pelagibaculum spongiae]PVZ70526.1 ABC transporter permease [Pelagibaculum spongiae]